MVGLLPLHPLEVAWAAWGEIAPATNMIDLVTVRHVGAATHGSPVIHAENMIDLVSVRHVVAQLH